MNNLQMPMLARQAWGVASLLLACADALQARFGSVTVQGELASVVRAASGHLYFSLKDAEGAPALLKCAMFRRSTVLLDFKPADGQQVELRGRLALYEPRGELQFVAEAMRRVGEGALFEEFLRRRARLAEEGLFEPAAKRPIPASPQALGIVTSLGAAALRDVLTTLARRSPQVRAVVYPSLVQGSDAPDALVQALQQASQRQEVQAVLLVRGGGSLEDLWAFNDERVVRAIRACSVPVITGVGHETDFTLADMAADLRAPTPTAAAEMAAPSSEALAAALQGLGSRLHLAMRHLLDRQLQRLDALAAHLLLPRSGLQLQQQRLSALQNQGQRAIAAALRRHLEAISHLGHRLAQAGHNGLLRQQLQVQAIGHRLEALGPQQVLARGYVWMADAAGKPVMRAGALNPGQSVQATWADGTAELAVTAVRQRHAD